MSGTPTTAQTTLDIAGMDCADCAATLEKRLTGMPGVESCSIRFNLGTADIAYDPEIVTQRALSNRIHELGYVTRLRPSSNGVREFAVTGMDCADCAKTLQASIAAIPGVSSADVAFGTGMLSLAADPGRVTDAHIRSAAERLGYRAQPYNEPPAPQSRLKTLDRRALEIIAATGLVLTAFAFGLRSDLGAVGPVLHVTAAAIAGYPIFRAALVSVQVRRADMNLLMTIAAFGAIALRDWAEASTLMVLFALGLALQSATIDRTRGAIRELMAIAPATARVRRGALIESIPVHEVEAGDLVDVLPGERVPVDGTVVSGTSALDQAAITGESVPRAVSSGSEVLAGSVNGDGQLSIEASSPGTDTAMTRIIHLIERAHESKAPVQALVERFAAIYTPVVILAALLLATVGLVASSGDVTWIYRALILLVVACPCALVISTPVALVSALGRASKMGVLFKGGNALEALATVTQIAFDKTGTLTHGRPELVSIDVVVDEDKQSVLALAAALESGTTHPIGRGIIHGASGLELPDVLDIEVKQGQGIVGRVGTTPVQVGRSSLFSTIPVELAEMYEQGSETGRTVVMVGRDGTAVGALSLVDTVRPVSRSVIGQIRDLGLKPLLLSGDSATVASRIGTEVSIDDVRAELLPADKSWLVMEMDRESPMAMVGDGINDAPALAAARVGIAMGAGGSAAAIEAADVALMSDDLTRLPESVLLARSTRTIIQQNITFALVAKLAFLILTVGGYTSLWLAVLADVGASVLVTLNALRLMHDSSDTQR